jgi:hypothetical protein
MLPSTPGAIAFVMLTLKPQRRRFGWLLVALTPLVYWLIVTIVLGALSLAARAL